MDSGVLGIAIGKGLLCERREGRVTRAVLAQVLGFGDDRSCRALWQHEKSLL